jgi:hypothetical protein
MCFCYGVEWLGDDSTLPIVVTALTKKEAPSSGAEFFLTSEYNNYGPT